MLQRCGQGCFRTKHLKKKKKVGKTRLWNTELWESTITGGTKLRTKQCESRMLVTYVCHGLRTDKNRKPGQTTNNSPRTRTNAETKPDVIPWILLALTSWAQSSITAWGMSSMVSPWGNNTSKYHPQINSVIKCHPLFWHEGILHQNITLKLTYILNITLGFHLHEVSIRISSIS